MQPIWEKENSEYKPASLCLKTDLPFFGGEVGLIHWTVSIIWSYQKGNPTLFKAS